MASRGLNKVLKKTVALAAQVISGGAGAVNGATVDTAGYESVDIVVNVGLSGDTLSGSLKLDYKLQHGALADASDMADVAAADLIGGFTTIDDAAEDETVQSCGYRGGKRYVRVVVTKTGTHTNGTPHAATAILGDAQHQPVA